MKLLLHTCCGPCFLGVWEGLKIKGFDVINLYYNPNIQPLEEFDLRKKNLELVAIGKSKDIIELKYNPDEYLKKISGSENNKKERCKKCYELRLWQTAQTAKDQKINLFSTTLLVSPYQDREELVKIGERIARQSGLEFLPSDWRPAFRKGQEEAKKHNIYRQKYCGCIFSKHERNSSN